MHPILFKIGPVAVYSYGFMVALGFITATLLAARQAHEFNIPPEKVNELSLVILISGVLGARICYVLLNLKDFIVSPLEIFMVSHGGLVFYGGAIFAFLSSFIYVKIAKLLVLDTADLIAPYIALGHSVGRIGCLLNGCCYGKPTPGPLGIMLQDGVLRIPTQICSSLYLIFLYVILRVFIKNRRFKGEIFFSYLILYSGGRFFIEFFRGDNAPVILNLTFSQVVSIAVFIVGVVGYLSLKRWSRKK